MHDRRPGTSPGFHELAINNNATDGSVLIVWGVTLNTGVISPGDGSVMTAGFQLYPYIYGGTLIRHRSSIRASASASAAPTSIRTLRRFRPAISSGLYFGGL